MIVRAWRSRKKAGFLSSGIRSALVLLGGMFLVPLFLGSVGCGGEAPQPQLTQVRFSDEGLELSLSSPLPTGWVSIQEPTGAELQRLPLQGSDQAPRVLFSWQPDQAYTLVLVDSAGRVLSRLDAHSPAPRPLRALLHLPYGQTPLRLEEGSSLTSGVTAGGVDRAESGQDVSDPEAEAAPLISVLAAGAQVQLGLELRAEQALTVRLSVTADSSLRFRPVLPEQVVVQAGQPLLLLSTLTMPERLGELSVVLRLDATPVGGLSEAEVSSFPHAAHPGPLRLAAHTRLRVASVDALRAGIRLVEQVLPTDPQGRAQPERQPDMLVLTDATWWTLLGFLGQGALRRDPYAPVAWQTLRFRSTLPAPATLLLTSSVVDLESGHEVPGFVPQAFEVTGGLGTITSLARIPPGGEGQAVLPVYARPQVLDGLYQNRVEVRLLGSSPLLELRRPVAVSRRQLGLLSAMGLALASLGAGLALLMASWERLMGSLGPRVLTRIALLAAVEVAVGMGVDLTGVWLTVLLGPLSGMVTGLLFEGLHYGLVAVLMVLAPRPGVVALLGLTRAVVRGLMTGQVAPTDLLFLSSSLLGQEGFLWGMGVTRGKGVTLKRLALACVPASVLAALISLALHSVLFRLYYASWYWWLTVAVALLGPIPGIVYGLRWGRELIRIRD